MKKLLLLFLLSFGLYPQKEYSQVPTFNKYVPQHPNPYVYTQKRAVSCQDLYNYILENGYKKATIESYVMQSSWLYKVTAYEYDYKTYVVAEIKENEYSYRTNSYIFCSIPNLNWRCFQIGSYGDSNSYGERFHKYIFNYKCNCD